MSKKAQIADYRHIIIYKKSIATIKFQKTFHSPKNPYLYQKNNAKSTHHDENLLRESRHQLLHFLQFSHAKRRFEAKIAWNHEKKERQSQTNWLVISCTHSIIKHNICRNRRRISMNENLFFSLTSLGLNISFAFQNWGKKGKMVDTAIVLSTVASSLLVIHDYKAQQMSAKVAK